MLAFGDVHAAFSSHTAQSPAIRTLLGAMLLLLRDQRAAVLCHHICQPKYNYHANSSAEEPDDCPITLKICFARAYQHLANVDTRASSAEESQGGGS